MLRAMILIMVAMIILVVIATQVILPMMIEELELFWMFKKGNRKGIVFTERPTDNYEELNDKAQDAKDEYLSVKNIIKKQKSKLDKIDKNSEL